MYMHVHVHVYNMYIYIITYWDSLEVDHICCKLLCYILTWLF